MAIGPFIAAAAFSLGGLHQGSRADKYSRMAAEEQRKLAESRAAIERRRIVRESRIRQAEVMNVSAQTGTLGSSSQMSASSGLISQEQFNLAQSFANQLTAKRVQSLQSTANAYSTRAGIAGGLGNIASLWSGK